MDAKRIVRHLCTPDSAVRRHFRPQDLHAIEHAVRDSERGHGGEIRFAVEAALPLSDLLRGTTARDRAVELFGKLRVWDTERNTGVLIYLLLADRDVEIVADRGVAGADWDSLCREMERRCAAGDYAAAALAGIAGAGQRLATNAPRGDDDRNELGDAPHLG